MLENYFKKHNYIDSRVLARHIECATAREIGKKFDVRIYRPRGSEILELPKELPAALDRAVQVCKTLGKNSPQYVTSEVILRMPITAGAEVRAFLYHVNIILTLEV